MQKLSATAVKQAKPKPYKLADGGGLYLHVKPNGKYWRYKYRFANKEKLLALGVYPDTSLADVRKSHQASRKSLANGIDPNAAKQAQNSTKFKSQPIQPHSSKLYQNLEITRLQPAPSESLFLN
jgi:hypothetical protein